MHALLVPWLAATARVALGACQRAVEQTALRDGWRGGWRSAPWGTVNWTRCATHLYVVAEGVLTCARRHLSRVLPRRAPRLHRLTSPRSTDPLAAPISRRRVLRSMTRARLFPGIRILTKKLKENISYVILYYTMGTFKNCVLFLSCSTLFVLLLMPKSNSSICTC